MKQFFYTAMLILFTMFNTYAQKSAVFAPEGKAIRGYDPVAFFKMSKPIMGKDSLAYNWQDATWLFSSRENLEDFKNNPEKYAPQYGGYCAYGTSQHHKAPTETDTWTIVNDKLYFNYNKKVQQVWIKDQKAFIEKADQQWPDIKNKE
jgi:YHS domain-containing protein